MDILICIANGLYLLSYVMKDILHLRILTVVAASCLVVYFYLQPAPMMTAVYWNLFFIALNLYQVAQIVSARNRDRKGTDASAAMARAGVLVWARS